MNLVIHWPNVIGCLSAAGSLGAAMYIDDTLFASYAFPLALFSAMALGVMCGAYVAARRCDHNIVRVDTDQGPLYQCTKCKQIWSRRPE